MSTLSNAYEKYSMSDSLLALLQPLWGEASQSLKAYKAEVDELRAAPGDLGNAETPQALHERVTLSRRMQDRLEAIVADLGMVRSRCKLAVTEAQDAYDDKWRMAMLKSRTGEYASAQEKNATYAASAIDELVALRKAKRMLAEVEEVYDYALFKFKGLDGSRRDTESVLRMVSVETTLRH